LKPAITALTPQSEKNIYLILKVNNLMKTTLFNLHEIIIDNSDLTIEFYAGDIFDIYSDILVLSAFKGEYSPVAGTTWGSLAERTGINKNSLKPEAQTRISENLVAFATPPNDCFQKLVALEMSNLAKKHSFTMATLKSRYRELAQYLGELTDAEDESVSMPLFGTGNQGLSLDDSVTEMLNTISRLKNTRLKVIRIFANQFETIGMLNQKINGLLNRNMAVPSQLLGAAFEEIQVLGKGQLSPLSHGIIEKLTDLSVAENNSLNSFGIAGRHFAENLSGELLSIFRIEETPGSLHQKIQLLTPVLVTERPYVISYLRLLQNYGNQVAHPGNPNLNHQDAAAIIIAVVRIVDYYEDKLLNLPASLPSA
jgi:hypothetical protein